MEYKEIKQLMEDMENSSLSSLDISLPDGTKISIQKEGTYLMKHGIRSFSYIIFYPLFFATAF